MNSKRKDVELFFTALFILSILPGAYQVIQGCPLEWELFQQSCYKFIIYPELNYQDAKMACLAKGAGVVSINTRAEQDYITEWIKRNAIIRHNWYTSGLQVSKDTTVFRWEGDGTPVPDDLYYWLSEADRNKQGEIIVLAWKDAVVGWSRSPMAVILPYICEIPQVEAYRIVQDYRDFDYGTNVTDANEYLRGPTFSVEATDVVIVSQKETKASVECVAIANPQAEYGWSHIDGTQVIDITPDYDPRYILTNGRLTIEQPEEGSDSGYYQCRAHNQFGLILGSIIQLSFGSLGEFSNVPREAVRTYEYDGAAIECIPPKHKPALTYQWYKNHPGNFVRPALQPYLFISAMGRLYFSEVTRVDEGRYFCVATLSTNYGSSEIKQTPSRTSLPTELQVIDGAAREWGPDIHSDFIAVFPTTPQRGHLLRMECFAYGTTPLTYWWTRENGEIPERAMYRDDNRILFIPDVQLEDSGPYKCSVRRTAIAAAEKTINLVISAKPYFNFPLRHKHVDVGSQLTWRCGAKAVPTPTYAWFKNGEVIVPATGQIEISQNVLTIKNLDPVRHNGMYQCSATNIYGTSISSAQLRVLSIAPSFKKFPIRPLQDASVGGNLTYICEPEAAPFPVFKWAKNGGDLGLVPGGTGRLQLLRNGNLLITQIQQSDAGRYTCTATNMAGTASSSGTLRILTGTVITQPPSPTTVLLNETAFLFCRASYNPNFDMIYRWLFNGEVIDVSGGPHFGWGTDENAGGLYIRFARFKHGGQYECRAKTVIDEAKHSVYVTVIGPPGPPAGVQVDGRSITSYTMKVRWTVGASHGRPITAYVMQARTTWDMHWRYITGDIPDMETVEEGQDMRRYIVRGLRPGNGYMFRLAAKNNLGQGDWSWPSDVYQTPGAPPSVEPRNIVTASGRVGVLSFRWEPLDQSEHNGLGMGYHVYWRRKGVNLQTWSKDTVYGNTTFYATTVGVANYYLEYEIQVQAFNIHGPGPNSTITVVYSAEGMPTGVPTGVYADPYNSTSLMIHWKPLPNTREYLKGRILGYQVNYYIADAEDPILYASTYLGNGTSGLLVGLYPGTFYWSGVQVYNTAGLGPESETDLEQTYAEAPRQYPTEVAVYSVEDAAHVRVTYRGVSTGIGEEPLLGYKLRYWLFNDDVRNARDIIVGKHMEGTINGLEKGYIYELRVLGYSNGGDGKMSPSVFFTLEGGQVRIDPDTAEMIGGSNVISINFTYLVLFVVLQTLAYVINTDVF